MGNIRPPKLCRLFLPGHHPHWIQVRKGMEDTERPPRAGRLIDVSPQGLIVIEVDGQELRIWNHDPLRLIEASALGDGRIRYQASWRLLFAGGGYTFCAAVPPEDHVPCREP